MEKNNKFGVKNIVYIAVFSILIAICSWISIPSTIPFTLQTFAVFLTIYLLGGRDATISIIVYLLLGIIGVPVFSNFGSGIGVIIGPTGGYLIGFIFISLIMWLIETIFKNKLVFKIIGSIIGLIVCYVFGTIWFQYIYLSGDTTFLATLSICVLPYIIPDIIKIAIALLLDERLKKILGLKNLELD